MNILLLFRANGIESESEWELLWLLTGSKFNTLACTQKRIFWFGFFFPKCYREKLFQIGKFLLFVFTFHWMNFSHRKKPKLRKANKLSLQTKIILLLIIERLRPKFNREKYGFLDTQFINQFLCVCVRVCELFHQIFNNIEKEE